MALVMPSLAGQKLTNRKSRLNNGLHNHLWHLVLMAAAALIALLFLFLPLVIIFATAFSKGIAYYFHMVFAPETLAAIKISLLLAAVAVPLNMVFGMAASWVITKFEFRGKNLLITLIELPFSVSPVICGLMWVLIFGLQGWLGPFLHAHNIGVLFAFPSMLLAIIFVTFPFVARELIPMMQQQGTVEEEAAISLGARFWQVYSFITLPNIRIGLIYGLLLSNARAFGEFGAVAIVSGHLRGMTTTIPLEVEILFNDYNAVGAFVVASLLSLTALVTLLVRYVIESRHKRSRNFIEENAEYTPTQDKNSIVMPSFEK